MLRLVSVTVTVQDEVPGRITGLEQLIVVEVVRRPTAMVKGAALALLAECVESPG